MGMKSCFSPAHQHCGVEVLGKRVLGWVSRAAFYPRGTSVWGAVEHWVCVSRLSFLCGVRHAFLLRGTVKEAVLLLVSVMSTRNPGLSVSLDRGCSSAGRMFPQHVWSPGFNPQHFVRPEW